MAKCEMKMPDDMLRRLSSLGDKTDTLCSEVLEAGGEVVLAKVKRNLSASVGKDTKENSRSTGELEKSLGLTPVKVDRDGNYNVKIGFSEPRSDGDSNAKIANILEYGKSGQPPKPFLKPAITSSKSECMETMKRKFNEVVGGI